jgi:hypothetical protein
MTLISSRVPSFSSTPYTHKATYPKMASNRTRNQLLRPCIKKICNRLCPIAAYLDSRWLEFCEREDPFRFVRLVRRPPSCLAKHEYYKKFPRVQYYDIMIQDAGEEVYASIKKPSEKLRKAVLTWCTCDHAATVCWLYLERELKSMSETSICVYG